jgi:hypothetical protein
VDWGHFRDLTIDKALWQVISWRTNISTVIDVFLSNDTTPAQEIPAVVGSPLEILTAIARKIGAAPLCDRLGRLFIEVDYQYLNATDRAAVPIVMDVTKKDWKEEIEINRKMAGAVAMLELNAAVYDGVTTTQVYSRAPGNRPGKFGKPQQLGDYVVIDQTRVNELAGLLLAAKNNPFPSIPIKIAQTNRMIDICPRQLLTQSIAALDNLKGIVWTSRKLIPRRVELVLNQNSHRIHTEVDCEAEVTGALGVTYHPPAAVTQNINYDMDYGIGNFDFNPSTSPWTPDTIPIDTPATSSPACTDVDAPVTGPFQLWADKPVLDSSDPNKTVVYIWFPCKLRPADCENQTKIYLTAQIWYLIAGIQEQSYNTREWKITAIDANKNPLLVGANSIIMNGAGYMPFRYTTFGPPAELDVAGFMIEVIDPDAPLVWDFALGFEQGWYKDPANTHPEFLFLGNGALCYHDTLGGVGHGQQRWRYDLDGVYVTATTHVIGRFPTKYDTDHNGMESYTFEITLENEDGTGKAMPYWTDYGGEPEDGIVDFNLGTMSGGSYVGQKISHICLMCSFNSNTHYCYSVEVTNISTPITNYKIELQNINLYNVCGVSEES